MCLSEQAEIRRKATQNEEAIQRAVAAEAALDVFITSKVSPYEVHRHVAT